MPRTTGALRRLAARAGAGLLALAAAMTPATAGTVPPRAGAAPLPGAPGAPADGTPLPLARHFDNRGVSEDAHPQYADFDGSGASLSAGALAAAGWTPGRTVALDGAELTWPRPTPSGDDNVRANGQSVRVEGRGEALVLLVAGTRGDATGTGTVHYRDGGHAPFELTAPDWRRGPLGAKAVALPHLNKPSGRVAERALLYAVSVPLRTGRPVSSVTLPRDPAGADLHVFALSVRPGATGWTGTWSAAPGTYAWVGPWTDRTLRLVTRTTAGGPRVRLRFENAFAREPVRIGAVSVARRRAGAQTLGRPVPVTFGGRTGTEVPAGARAVSDPVDLAVPAGDDLLVSFHLPGTVRALPLHREAAHTSYLGGPGNRTRETGGGAYPTTLRSWPLLTGVDVAGGEGSLVVVGDSITDASSRTRDTDRRWTDLLAARLHRQHRTPRYGVLNQAISANRILTDRYPGDGESAESSGVSVLNRLDRDVLAQTSPRALLVFQGVNDLRWGATAEEVLDGLRRVTERARTHGLRTVVATLAPCGGEKRCTPEVDARRQTVNAALRARPGHVDAVLDADRVLRDPERPERLLPRYDSGDHLHPGDAGLVALTDAVDLRTLGP
ncbi:GDSL-type esterase/lipase family protein [Streptomyces sp. NPDC049906]|uniref:GDSL-type esterase/lipase family protein n=1 Tax=Streptomyces sp. NPDC049906 TaxID=3155656 RepID=UPI0034285070